ncbi:MAG: preprotein translocase subunit SecE [Oscillospiraceae bacterium]|nr:preprotein translocase subunit SecE [Oscillospiraceae bacterium]
MAEAKEKKPNIFARMARSVRDMRGEMKRVVWPSRKQTINNTLIVLGFMAIMAVLIGVFDTGLSWIIRLVFGT